MLQKGACRSDMDRNSKEVDRLSLAQLLLLGVEGLGQIMALVVLATLALLALYLKLEQLKEVTHLGPHQWTARNWLQFIGFANQIMGIVGALCTCVSRNFATII